METNKLNESLELVLGVVRKLHPHEANVVLAQAIDQLIEERDEQAKTHREQDSLLSGANEKLRKILNKSDEPRPHNR